MNPIRTFVIKLLSFTLFTKRANESSHNALSVKRYQPQFHNVNLFCDYEKTNQDGISQRETNYHRRFRGEIERSCTRISPSPKRLTVKIFSSFFFFASLKVPADVEERTQLTHHQSSVKTFQLLFPITCDNVCVLVLAAPLSFTHGIR